MEKKKPTNNELEELSVKCLRLSDNFEGMARIENKNLYVKDFLPGEEAIVVITKDNGNVMQGYVKKYLTNSPVRLKTLCPVFYRCGACNLLNVKYEFQLEYKANLVYDKLRQAGFNNFNFQEIKKMDRPFNYRNKIIVGFKYSKINQVVPALYEEESDTLVSINNCLIQSKLGNEVLNLITEGINRLKIIPYDITGKKRGVLKFVLIRIAEFTKEVMIVFVTASDIFPARNDLVKYLTSKSKDIKTIVQNTNSRDTSVVLGDKERILYGNGTIKDKLCQMDFIIGSKSFYQVNPKQTEYLYNKAIELCQFKGFETILDCYSGIGTIGLSASKYVYKVFCVELNKEAHKNAIFNAKINNVKNVRFFNADCTEFMLEMQEAKEKIDVIFLDPPRDGSTKEFMEALLKIKAEKIIYISCNPLSLVNDLKYISKEYILKEIVPVDLFPQTLHVETIALLEKNSKA